MAIEDFGTFTELDPNSKISVGTRRITFTGIERNILAYVLLDKGVNYFSGDFIHLITFNVSASAENEVISPWVMSNDIGGLGDFYNDLLDGFVVQVANPAGVFKINFVEIVGGDRTWTSTFYTLTLGTTYYLKIVRDESVGTYGTLYLFIYDDVGRTNLISTITHALHTSADFRYITPLVSYGRGPAGHTATGYVENLELFSVLTGELALANTYLTDFTDTAVTGNAYIVNTGISSVTEHGHVWGTSLNPTTADSYTTLGAGVLGLFSSSVTGLITGQQYYMRGYATNTEGTAYSPNIGFIAGRRGTPLIAGNLAIVQGHLQYIDASGVEKYIPGIPA